MSEEAWQAHSHDTTGDFFCVAFWEGAFSRGGVKSVAAVWPVMSCDEGGWMRTTARRLGCSELEPDRLPEVWEVGIAFDAGGQVIAAERRLLSEEELEVRERDAAADLEAAGIPLF